MFGVWTGYGSWFESKIKAPTEYTAQGNAIQRWGGIHNQNWQWSIWLRLLRDTKLLPGISLTEFKRRRDLRSNLDGSLIVIDRFG